MQKFLVIRIGGVGDTLLLLPFISALRKTYPESYLEFMGYPERIQIFKDFGYADEIKSFDQPGMSSFFVEESDLPKELVKYFTKFDIILVFLKDGKGIFSGNLQKCGVHPVRNPIIDGKIFSNGVKKFYLFSPYPDKNIHVFDYYKNLAHSLGLKNNGAKALFLQKLGKNRPSGWLTAAIHPGAGSKKKCWPAKYFAEIIDWLEEKYKIKTLLISGPADETITKEVLNFLEKSNPQIVNNLSLTKLAVLLNECLFYLGNDSGITHLSAFTRIPTMAIFNQENAKIWAPRAKNVHFCVSDSLEKISPIEMKEKIKHLLNHLITPACQVSAGKQSLNTDSNMDEFYIQWHITNLCNLRCRHCYQEYFNSDEDLPWLKLKTIYENILSTTRQWNKKMHITITGGEPLLKKETFLLLDYLDLKDEISELSLITNGFFLNEEICQRLDDSSKLKKIKISLDGANEKTNDFIRGRGTFSKVMKAIEKVKKFSNLQITLMFTVMKINLKEIEDIFELCKDFNLEGLTVERFIPLGQGISIEEQILDKEEWKSLANILLRLYQISCSPEEILPYRAFQIKFNSPSHPEGTPMSPSGLLRSHSTISPTLELLGAPCTAGTDGLCIMPDGIVYPCRRFNLPVGNLLEQSLSEIWQNSEVLNKIREKNNLQGKCKECPIKECRGCRALAYALTGDYLAEDTQCWYSSPAKSIVKLL